MVVAIGEAALEAAVPACTVVVVVAQVSSAPLLVSHIRTLCSPLAVAATPQLMAR